MTKVALKNMSPTELAAEITRIVARERELHVIAKACRKEAGRLDHLKYFWMKVSIPVERRMREIEAGLPASDEEKANVQRRWDAMYGRFRRRLEEANVQWRAVRAAEAEIDRGNRRIRSINRRLYQLRPA